jgi:hypothetical protein
MQIDVASETLLTFTEAARSLPKRVHPSTIFRWKLRGVRGVRLESCVIGGRRFTSAEAIERFAAATTAAADGMPSSTRTPRQRQRDIERAEAELAKVGI